jgi:hypothetical protein
VFVTLGTQHALRMHYMVICGLPRSTVFFYFISGTARFTKKKSFTEHKMCVLIFSTNLSETFLTLRRTERDMLKIYVGHHLKYPLFLSDFNETWFFSTGFRKILKY